MRRGTAAAILLSVLALHGGPAARASDHVDIHAYVNDACIVADEPFYFPALAEAHDAAGDQAKFLPLIGLVVGKLAELFIGHEIEAQANQFKSKGARKDTRYAVTRVMNLYRVDTGASASPGINAKLGCMTIVAAKLLPEGANCGAAYIPKALDPASSDLPQDEWKTTRTDDSVENQLRRANICVDGRVAAVYEARFEFSKDGTAYRLRDAGYRINTLLTTDDKRAKRTALYTLKISQPSVTEQEEVLSSAWVKLGTVTAGARSAGAGDDSAPWLHVPPLSPDARRAFEEKTGPQQEAIGAIDALKRSLTRNQRIQDGLDQRIAASRGEVAEGLKQERTKVAVQIQLQGAELDARTAELQDLPHSVLEFMPVTIEVAVTETESEKKADLALADLIGASGGMVASAVGNAATSMLSKSLDTADLKTDPGGGDGASDLDSARSDYFDALVEAETHRSGDPGVAAARKLSLAKARYNAVRRSLGLEALQ
jgi:hypothetical protein